MGKLSSFGQPQYPSAPGSQGEQWAAQQAFASLFPTVGSTQSIEGVAADLTKINNPSSWKPQAPVQQPAQQPKSVFPSGGGTSTRNTAPSSGMGSFGAISDPITAPPVPPAAPTIPTAASDPAYQQQMADLARAMADYEATLGLESNQYEGQYTQGLDQLGYNNASGDFDWKDTSRGAGQSMQGIIDDFASRGMAQSGLFEKAKGDLVNNYTQRKTGFDTSRQDFLAQQGQRKQTYQNQNTSASTQALMEAISRIAAQYQIDPSQVLSGV